MINLINYYYKISLFIFYNYICQLEAMKIISFFNAIFSKILLIIYTNNFLHITWILNKVFKFDIEVLI